MNYLVYSICKNAPLSLCLFTMEIFRVCVKTHYLVVLDQFFYKQILLKQRYTNIYWYTFTYSYIYKKARLTITILLTCNQSQKL